MHHPDPTWLRAFGKRMGKIFGIKKPFALGLRQWSDWDEKTKKENPVGWFMSETVPDIIDRTFLKPYYMVLDLRWWFTYRFNPKCKYHLIDTKLEPGYADSDYRMLHGMFALLVDFVEVELAGMHQMSHKEAGNKYRDPASGLEYLKWEMTLPGRQGLNAKEQMALYMWWTVDRPKRETDNYTFEKQDKERDEDTDMLVRLVKVRGAMWT